jgi:hypothetical protein
MDEEEGAKLEGREDLLVITLKKLEVKKRRKKRRRKRAKNEETIKKTKNQIYLVIDL